MSLGGNGPCERGTLTERRRERPNPQAGYDTPPLDAYSAFMAHSSASSRTDYEDLHATVVDALSFYVKAEALDQAADAALDGLRGSGLSIPAKPSA